jgi:RNA polymerase sigma-70 factor (ECF subfamily)
LAEDKGFEKIIERNGKSIYKIAFVYMKNRFDADDVYQEVLLRYLKYRPHFENCEHEKNWFVAVTINVCKSFKTSAWQRHNVTRLMMIHGCRYLQIIRNRGR